MSRHDDTRPSLDEIVDTIRTTTPSRDEIDGAAARVRTRLGLEGAAPAAETTVHIESCAGFQALIPAYLGGKLPRETALLLEDHSRECIPCRRALLIARQPAAYARSAADVPRRTSRTRLLAAAAVAAVAIVGAYTAWRVLPALGADPHLKVMRIDGNLFQVRAGDLVALRPGMTVSAKEAVRTAKDSGALVMMDDGSRIEMRDRTELAVDRGRDGSTVRLGAGAIIVEASPQGSGHLDVRTDDCLVAVKGTIFSVNHGTRGSRVSVVEGAVRVAADGRESLLKPGDQVTTTDALAAVSVQDEIAWSKDAERYDQLLRELASLRKDLDARVPNPAMRYRSELLDKMPDGTVLYAAIPNVTDALVESKRVFEEHIAQSEALQAWWNEHMRGPEQQKEMDETFERIQAYGHQLGDEIVVSLSMDAAGHVRGPIVTSVVKDPEALRRLIAKDLRSAPDGQEIADKASLTFDGNLMRLECKEHAAAAVAGGPWAVAPLHEKLQAAYAEGASWLFAADLKTMLGRVMQEAEAHGGHAEGLERTGLLDAEYVVFKRTEEPGGAEHRAEISFDQPRRGIAGWLASPAPLGAAEFVSPDASFMAAAVMRRPELLLSEALTWVGPGVMVKDDGNVALFEDLARTLGGDVVFALDGPVLPVPSWKLAIEVYDTEAFRRAFDALVAKANDQLAASGHEGRIVVEPVQAGNRTDWVVRYTGNGGSNTPMRYTFVDGYLVAAPSQVMIDHAIEQRQNGYTLTRSKEFQALLPTDGEVNVSAAVWQKLGPVVGQLAGQFSAIVDSEEARRLEAMAGESRPRLVTAYAEPQRIVVGSRGEAGIGSLLGSIMSANELQMLGRLAERAKADRTP
ncbi:MAG TPA: FecR domain-containing protein [Candidatus Polarisedimenticolaceae bacterium]|nr:FecR domain-containing protein [Candidatus Polarisedimenticolaceae bacterium]